MAEEWAELPASAVPETSIPPSAGDFFEQHVTKNMPLVIRGAALAWPAMQWSADGLSAAHGNEAVKVAPLEVDGPHAHLDKWLEPSSTWDHEEHEYCCEADSLLVVSALRVKMRLKTFFKRLRAPTNHTFYADGAGNLDHSFPFLRGDFAPPPFAQHLRLKRADLWIGGNSISRMHYDNLDNVFAQVVGSKTFVLSPPDRGAVLQGGKRLRKAARLYSHPSGEFSREGGGVLHETVLNYLGVERPPSLPTLSVTLGPGDMLYLPFGWWHEVHSHPDAARGNITCSVSHFYTPYFCRFGGKECMTLGPLMRNPAYDGGGDEREGEGHAASKSALLTITSLTVGAAAVAIALVGTAAVLRARG